MQIITKAEDLLTKSSEITLASINEKGYPIVRVLSKTKSDGIRKFWVSTGLSSAKIKHFKANPKASACFFNEGNGVTLVGKVSIHNDYAIKAEMWFDWFIEHYPGGIDDPNYCILEFETEEAALWIDQEFVNLQRKQL